jgi:hypothetical protein
MGEIRGGHGEEERRTLPVGRRGGGGWELSFDISLIGLVGCPKYR